MDVLNISANQLADQSQRFSAIAGLVQSNPEDRFFLVMGKTGSGKSTFIARCTGQDVTVGHGLYSCTSAIDTYGYFLSLPKPHGWVRTRRIHLIDTPSFNDTGRSDIETLGILASYLGASYANGVQIHGIIFLHPITDNRMRGSSMRTMEMLKMICGSTSYENMAAQTLSARRIVAHLIGESDSPAYQPKPPQIQREIIDEGKTLGELIAGTAIADDLDKARRDHEGQLRELEEELRTQFTKSDLRHAAELEGLKAEILNKIAKAEEEKIQDLDEEFREKIAEKEEDLHELKESTNQIQQNSSYSQWSPNGEDDFHVHEQIVNTASQEIADAKRTRDRLQGVAGTILNGLANGAAGAITTSVVGGIVPVLCDPG
ncbi:hypothetical protein BJY01DRAFT_255785 [Aspergillus pseudoustus]|uniref:G domain-containing protein n=1 Tax=Aspergillus pseudoustus TaxID=1810923 RepID=A0ABR4IHR5_9EURO